MLPLKTEVVNIINQLIAFNMEYDENARTQEIKLKDGRTLFKTHNGFKRFVEDKKGEITEVTSEYYQKSKKHKI